MATAGLEEVSGMWSTVTAWVWLVLSLAMVGVLAVAVLCISTPFRRATGRAEGEVGGNDDPTRTPSGTEEQRSSRKLGHHAER